MQIDIDSLVAEEDPDSDLHAEFMIMKCHVWNLLGSVLGPNEHLDFTREVMESLVKAMQVSEPMNTMSIGILPYIEALHHYCFYLKLVCKPLDSLKNGLKLEKAFVTYTKSTNDPPVDGKEIFFIRRSLELPPFKFPEVDLHKLYLSQLGAIYLIYEELGDTDKAIKYTAGAIRADIDSSKAEGGIFYVLEQMVLKIEVLLTEFHFKHLDYLLSIAMYHAVKLRRSWPEEKRAELNDLQGKLSLFYAQWGEAVLLGSRCIIEAKSPMYICNTDDFETIPELEERGIEQYAGQFPTDYIKSVSEMKVIRKKAYQWVKRAVEMLNEGEDKRIAQGLKVSLKRDEYKLNELQQSDDDD